MLFRFAIESDLLIVARLNRELLAIEGPGDLFSDDELCARLLRWLSDGHKLLVFENDSEVVGYALYLPGLRDTGERIIYLRHFVIAQSHRRNGFGRKAMMHLTNALWPADAMICVETRETNSSAIHFWQLLKFKLFSCTFVCGGLEDSNFS